MRIGYPTITWGGVVGMPGGVTSVKEAFYLTNGSTDQAFRDIAAAGYTGTEVFDGNLLEFVDDRGRFDGLLAETGLALAGVYTGANFVFEEIVDEELHKITRAAELAASFGAGQLVIGGGAQRSTGPADGDFERLAEGLDRCDAIAAEHGITATYHPHLGTLVETPDALERVMALSGIRFCPDTAHLAGGGGDPAALIRKYGHRLAHVHLKDWDSATRRFLPLGEGELDFPGILEAIREVGYDDWLMVELDYYEGDPKVAAEISRAYLDPILIQKEHNHV